MSCAHDDYLIRLTGIPPHVIVLIEIETLRKKMRNLRGILITYVIQSQKRWSLPVVQQRDENRRVLWSCTDVHT